MPESSQEFFERVRERGIQITAFVLLEDDNCGVVIVGGDAIREQPPQVRADIMRNVAVACIRQALAFSPRGMERELDLIERHVAQVIQSVTHIGSLKRRPGDNTEARNA